MSDIHLKSQHLSRVIGCKQLKVVDGQVCYKGEPVVCRWCKWTPKANDVRGVDGLILGGFTKVRWLAQLAKRKHYRFAVHSCRGRQANPLVVREVRAEAEAPQRAVAEATVEVG